MSEEKKTTKEKETTAPTVESVLGKERMEKALAQPQAVGFRLPYSETSKTGPEGLLECATAMGTSRHPAKPEAAALVGAIHVLSFSGSKPDLDLLRAYSASFASPKLAEEVAWKEALVSAKEKLRALDAKES